MIIGLFENEIIKTQTNHFYIGMLYNLMNLWDNRVFKYTDRHKIMERMI